MLLLLLLGGLLLDGCFADYKTLNQLVGHPVEWVGRLAILLEKRLNHGGAGRRFISGGLVTFSLLTLSLLCAHLIIWLALSISMPPFNQQMAVYYVISAFLLGWLVAAKSLYRHVSDVLASADNLAQARLALAKIVGRKTDDLDENHISRAAIETLSENFSDAVIAPAFYFVLFGLEGLFVYKTLNTLDSIYGYHNQRYGYFGKLPAILDDVANFIPARLTALLILLAGLIFAQKNIIPTIKLCMTQIAPLWRYYFKTPHISPNACWVETAYAGLLNIQLGGKRQYQGDITHAHIIGATDARQQVAWADIARALRLYRYSMGLLIIMIFSAVVLSVILPAVF